MTAAGLLRYIPHGLRQRQGDRRQYRRQEEIGTPYGPIAGFETLNDQAVTVRDRDTMQ
jgi:glycyl-tRNA synthetase (class II)